MSFLIIDYNPQTNTPLLEQRNITICTNRFCTDITKHDINIEFCPVCKKRLTKTIDQEDPFFVLISSEGEQNNQ
jgi:hypothetical protein